MYEIFPTMFLKWTIGFSTLRCSLEQELRGHVPELLELHIVRSAGGA